MFTQGWRDVTFLRWTVERDRVAPLLPRGTRPDEHDGATSGPTCGCTGVDEQGRRGVVFPSLDAERLLPVLAARWVAGLPYLFSRMRLASAGDVAVRIG